MNTPPKSPDAPPDVPMAPEPLEPAPLLSPQLRVAMRAELSPTAHDRARVRDAVWASLASGELSKSALRVEALMQGRVGVGGTKLVLGWSLASKLIAAGLLAAGVATLSDLGSTPAPVAIAPQTTKAPQAPPVTPVAAAPTAPTVAAVAASPVAPEEPMAVVPVAVPSHTDRAPEAKVAPALRASTRRARLQPSAAQEQSVAAPSVEKAAVAANSPAVNERIEEMPNAQAPQPQFELAAQLRMVRAASQALDHGDAPVALSQLQQYAVRYPGGALRVEAAALRAMALCSTQASDAAAVRESFLGAHASSPLAERVKRACAAVMP